MHLTSADKRAARDGFKFVVLRGGERVCYTTTAAEAKRECGKHGRVVSLSRGHYAARNPSSGDKYLRAQKQAAKLDAAIMAHATGKKLLHVGSRIGNDVVTKVGTHTIQLMSKDGWSASVQIPFIGASGEMTSAWHRAMAERNPSSGAKQRARGTRDFSEFSGNRGSGFAGLKAAEHQRRLHQRLGEAEYPLKSMKAAHKSNMELSRFFTKLPRTKLPNPRRRKYR